MLLNPLYLSLQQTKSAGEAETLSGAEEGLEENDDVASCDNKNCDELHIKKEEIKAVSLTPVAATDVDTDSVTSINIETKVEDDSVSRISSMQGIVYLKIHAYITTFTYRCRAVGVVQGVGNPRTFWNH